MVVYLSKVNVQVISSLAFSGAVVDRIEEVGLKVVVGKGRLMSRRLRRDCWDPRVEPICGQVRAPVG